jgi:hypothetical protein
MVTQIGYSVAGRSRGRVAPCAVYTWHVETRSASFLGEPQNQGRRFVSGLASEPLGRFSPVWPQNWWRRFLPVWPQNRWSVSWFGPQNQVGIGLSVAPQRRRKEVGVGHASRSSSLLAVEASLARVSQSGLKTDGGTTTGGARGTIAEVASEAS